MMETRSLNFGAFWHQKGLPSKACKDMVMGGGGGGAGGRRMSREGSFVSSYDRRSSHPIFHVIYILPFVTTKQQ